MWKTVLKAPVYKPFQGGFDKERGQKSVGHHPLPLIGSYLHILNRMLNPKDAIYVLKWWLHGRLKTLGSEMDPEQASSVIIERPIAIIEKLKEYVAYRQQWQPPTWEEFVSKIDDKDEFRAASAVFGNQFPKGKQDLTRYTKPSFRYRKPHQQAGREARHLGSFKAKYDEEVEKIYTEAHKDFTTVIDALEREMEKYRDSEQYKTVQNPRWKGVNWVRRTINGLKGDVKVTDTTHGINLWWRPDWDDIPPNFLLRIKVNISQSNRQYCIDEYMDESKSKDEFLVGRKKKIRSVCISAPADRVVGDNYVSILSAMDDVPSKQAFEQRIGNWHWQGNPGASGRNKALHWNLLPDDDEGHQLAFFAKESITKMRDIFNDWGQYWVKELPAIEVEEPENVNPGFAAMRTYSNRNPYGSLVNDDSLPEDMRRNIAEQADIWERRFSDDIRRSENWFDTLKEGGPITSGKAGITNMTFGGKKEEEEEEEEYRIIPQDDDFWRSEIIKYKRKKWMDAVDELMSDGRERNSRQVLDNDIINNRRDAPGSINITNYLRREVRQGNYRVTQSREVGGKVSLHFTMNIDEQKEPFKKQSGGWRESSEQHAERVWREMLQERGEEDLTKPKKVKPAYQKVAQSAGGYNPAISAKRKADAEASKKIMEEVWEEKRRLLERQRTQLGPEINQLKQAVQTTRQKVFDVLNNIENTTAAKQKIEEVKNILQQYPMLRDMLGHLETVEAMVQEG